MNISTKFRLKYFALAIALSIAVLCSIYFFENEAVIFAVVIPILLFGQIIIFSTTSKAICPVCGKFLFNGNNEISKYSIGFQTIRQV